MNERIKELAIESGLESTDFPYGEFGMPHEQLKFAELIIEECTSLVLDFKSQQHYEGWLDFRDLIKKHFCIE